MYSDRFRNLFTNCYHLEWPLREKHCNWIEFNWSWFHFSHLLANAVQRERIPIGAVAMCVLVHVGFFVCVSFCGICAFLFRLPFILMFLPFAARSLYLPPFDVADCRLFANWEWWNCIMCTYYSPWTLCTGVSKSMNVARSAREKCTKNPSTLPHINQTNLSDFAACGINQLIS